MNYDIIYTHLILFIHYNYDNYTYYYFCRSFCIIGVVF